MEELQDAIEDAQYVNAIATQEEGPRPVLAWEIPTEEQLADWEHMLRRNARGDETPLSLEWTLQRAIGFFLFSAFVKEDCNDYLRINFAEEVARWKYMKGKHRVERARKIVQVYCKPLSRDHDTGLVVFPKRTEIDEYDLARTTTTTTISVANSDRNSSSGKNAKRPMSFTPKELDHMYELNTVPMMKNLKLNSAKNDAASTALTMDPDGNQQEQQQQSSAALHFDEGPNGIGGYDGEDDNTITTIATTVNCLGVRGPILEEVFQSLREVDRANVQQRRSAPATDLIQPKRHSTNTTSPTSSSAEFLTSNPSSSAPQKPASSSNLRSQTQRYTSLRELTNSMRQRESANLSDALFDKLEWIVVEGLRRDYWTDFLQSEKFAKMRNFLWFQDRTVIPEDFFTMRVLGRGGFGLVTACKKGTSGKLYAMKVMNKKRIKLKKSETLTVNERKALAAVESPFVVNLKYSFHSKDDVYLILDLMTGGDLGYHLHQKGKFPKKECQYYGARIMLGLQALHDKGYVYRDLKPENCLLDEQGRVKITDLGLATKITPKLHGAAGTRGYWAPEMLRRDRNGKRLPYGHTVDWFSYGCCMAEFISGGNPFRSEAALNFGLERGKETKEKAIDHATMEMNPDFPGALFDPDAADFCRRLLEKNEKTRLGTNGCEEIMAHPWFKNMNWESVLSDRKRPPYVPPKDVNAASQSEIGNFTEDKQIQECVIDARDESYYKDWDWTNPHAYAAEVIEFLIYERETGEPLIPILQQSTCCCDIL